MRVFRSCGHILGGALLITGTTIGVGMLALPVATGPGGFVPSVVVYLVAWLYMLCTGLLLLEVCTWMPADSNLITMAHKLLGKPGKNACWLLYLFLFVTVMIAHVAGGGNVLAEITGGAISPHLSMILYVLVFSPIIYLGARSADRLNLLLMVGVAISYFLFIGVSYDHVKVDLLKTAHWNKIWAALPVLFTAFTYQVIIPTLMTYMERNVKKVRLAIIIGTTVPLAVYLIWQLLILGIVPADGPGSLSEAAAQGHNAVMPLKSLIKSPLLFSIGKAFAFFTMTTSYIGLSLAFLDFLADGLGVEKKGMKKVALCLAIFLPPTLISLTYPDIFLKALGYAGGISCAVLFGLYPPLMAWIGRYKKGHTSQPLLFGGKPMLFLLILFAVFELGLEILQQFK